MAITNIIRVEAFWKLLLSNVPKGTEKLNLPALKKGYEYGKKLLGEAGTNLASV